MVTNISTQVYDRCQLGGAQPAKGVLEPARLRGSTPRTPGRPPRLHRRRTTPTEDYDMVAQANRKAVSGRRSKAERRGGRQGSGRSAEQLASKIRARRSAGSWTKTGSRPGPLRKKKRLSVMEVDDPATIAEETKKAMNLSAKFTVCTAT